MSDIRTGVAESIVLSTGRTDVGAVCPKTGQTSGRTDGNTRHRSGPESRLGRLAFEAFIAIAWGFSVGLVAAVLTGCAVPGAPAPQPYLDIVRSGEWAKPDEVELDRATLLAGLARWEALGFRVVDAELELPECDWRWYEEEDRECVFTARYHARRELELREDAGYAVPQLRSVWLDADYSGAELERIVAHEVGHLLLFAGDMHLPAHQRGLMQATFGGDGPTPDDAAMFCRLLDVCGGSL